MKKIAMLVSFFIGTVLIFAAIAGANEQAKRGEALFKQLCSRCHIDGGNIINPQKTLHRKDLEANGVKTTADIVGRMRNPGTGMTKFNEKTVPDEDAKAIAEYILKTFR